MTFLTGMVVRDNTRIEWDTSLSVWTMLNMLTSELPSPILGLKLVYQ